MNLIQRIFKKIHRHRGRKRAEAILLQIKHFLDERNVKFLYVELPLAKKINLSDFEKERQSHWVFNFNHADEEMEKLKRIYGNDITSDYILSVFDGGIVVQGERRKVLVDFQSNNQHIINGRRITIGNPKKYHNSIYTHGACTWRGVGVEDSQTIASYLQMSINVKWPDSYKVVNSAIGRGSSLEDDFQFIQEQSYRAGDIVIVGSHGVALDIGHRFYERHSINYVETSSLFNRPHDIGEWFLDNVLHTNARGNKIIAQRLYKVLEDLGWLCMSCDNVQIPNDMEMLTHGQRVYGDNPFLLEYLKSLEPYRKGDNSSINGSIVMNCNPFTLGHRYLIEYAAKNVDNLYIFVVEMTGSVSFCTDRPISAETQPARAAMMMA